jgi:hypothetical protein
METIAVTKQQAVDLLAAATRRAAKTQKRKRKGGRGGVHGAAAYFAHIEGNVPTKTNTGSACAGHQLVRVVRGLRKSAGITHKSMGRVKFKVHKAGDKNDDGLAAAYPRGVACYMKWRPGVLPPPAPYRDGQPIRVRDINPTKRLLHPIGRQGAIEGDHANFAAYLAFNARFNRHLDESVEESYNRYVREDLARMQEDYEGAMGDSVNAHDLMERGRLGPDD